MAAKLDVYRDWLKLPDGPRPPDHYTLLGIERGEPDVTRINSAADARLKIVRPRCLKFPNEGTQLLNEIAQARLCLTDEEQKLAYDQQLAQTPTGNQAQWERIHSQGFSFDAELGSQLAALPDAPAETPSAASPAPRETVAEQDTSDSYGLAERSVPQTPAEESSTATRGRWCPHCGIRLLPKATFCSACSLSEISTTDWIKFTCRCCEKRMQAGVVICRKCKHDFAIVGPKPQLPRGASRNVPYYVTDLLNGTRQLDPELISRSAGQLDDSELTRALQDEIGDESESKPHLKSRKKQEIEEKEQREAEAAAALENQNVFVSLWNDLLELNEEHHIFMWSGLVAAILLVCILPLFLMNWNAPSTRALESGQHGIVQIAANARENDGAVSAGENAPGTKQAGEPDAKTKEPFRGLAPLSESELRTASQAALRNMGTSPADLMDYKRQLVTAAEKSPNPKQLLDLAESLERTAEQRFTNRFSDDLAAADEDSEFQALRNELDTDLIRGLLKSANRESLLTNLNRQWCDSQLAALATRMQEHMSADEFVDAAALSTTSFSGSLPTAEELYWKDSLLQRYASALDTRLNELSREYDTEIRTYQIIPVLDSLVALEAQFSVVPPKIAMFTSSQRDQIASFISGCSSDELALNMSQEDLQRAVLFVINRSRWKLFGEKLRAQLQSEGRWEVAGTAIDESGAVVAREVERKPFKDPVANYLAEKNSVMSRLDSKVRLRYNQWYTRLYSKHGHKAGNYVLIKENRVYVVGSLAQAAKRGMELDLPPAKGEKRTPIQTDWYGTLEEANQAYPAAVDQSYRD